MRGRDSLTVLRIYSLAGSPGVDNDEHTRQVVGLRLPTLCSISRADRSDTRGRLLTVKIVGSGSKDSAVASAARTQVNAAVRQFVDAGIVTHECEPVCTILRVVLGWHTRETVDC